MITDEDLTSTLVAMDPAPARTRANQERAAADLVRILNSDPLPKAPRAHPPASQRRTRPTVRRIATAGVLVAAVAAAVSVAPSLAGTSTAYATWRGTPGGMPTSESEQAAAGCRDQLRSSGPVDAPTLDALADAPTALSERRGTWTTIVLGGQGAFTAMCITSQSQWSAGMDWFGSTTGGEPGHPQPGPRQLIANNLGTGHLDAGDLSVAAGLAGDDVMAVTYLSPHHGQVTATIGSGRFALWLPGDDFKDAPTAGVDVEVTYRDGTTAPATLAFPTTEPATLASS